MQARRRNPVERVATPGLPPRVVGLDTTVVVLSAGGSPYFRRVLEGAGRCVVEPDGLLVVWSGATAPPHEILPRGVGLVCVPPASYDHGGTRQLVVDRCNSAVVAFLSDDAEPADAGWLRALVAPLRDPSVGAVYGRQIARPDAPLAERVFRLARYPNRSLELSPRVFGVPITFPMSDANAAYRVEALAGVGGFPRPCSFAEDHIVTHRLLEA